MACTRRSLARGQMYVVSQIVIAPNRFCVVSIFRQCHGTIFMSTGLVTKARISQSLFKLLRMNSFLLLIFKSIDVTTDSAIVEIKFLYRIILLSSGFSLIFLERKCRFFFIFTANNRESFHTSNF